MRLSRDDEVGGADWGSVWRTAMQKKISLFRRRYAKGIFSKEIHDFVSETANARKKRFNSVNGLGSLLNPLNQFTEARIPLSSTVDKTPTNFDIYSLRLFCLLPPHFWYSNSNSNQSSWIEPRLGVSDFTARDTRKWHCKWVVKRKAWRRDR